MIHLSIHLLFRFIRFSRGIIYYYCQNLQWPLCALQNVSVGITSPCTLIVFLGKMSNEFSVLFWKRERKTKSLMEMNQMPKHATTKKTKKQNISVFVFCLWKDKPWKMSLWDKWGKENVRNNPWRLTCKTTSGQLRNTNASLSSRETSSNSVLFV